MLRYTIQLTSEARDDIQNTTDYLNEIKPKLGNDFFIEMAEVIDVLRDNPFIFQKKYKELRQALVKRFSFLIHYTILEEELTVIIFGILHASRNPQMWKNRMT